mmetsp:Transcript_561/g.1782  ORF Transcript_561/g.1782 Transcript_561/m.1782 type:complete len:251 (-) Transcript_561:240-992(-)
MSPANRTFGYRTRSKLLKSGYSNALEISTTRSARKFAMTTASSSSTVPTGLPSASVMTNGSTYWSLSPPSFSLFSASIGSVNLCGASPRTCAFHPRSTIAQSASYRSIVTFMRPPPDATLASHPSSFARSSTRTRMYSWQLLSGTSRPSVRTCSLSFLHPSATAPWQSFRTWSYLECTPPEERSVMTWSVLSAKAGLTCAQPAPEYTLFVSSAMSTRDAPWAMIFPAPRALWPTSLFPMSPSVGRPTAGP